MVSNQPGTATSADYTFPSPDPVLSFAANETSKFITIPIREDTIYEGNETFQLLLGNPQGASEIVFRRYSS